MAVGISNLAKYSPTSPQSAVLTKKSLNSSRVLAGRVTFLYLAKRQVVSGTIEPSK